MKKIIISLFWIVVIFGTCCAWAADPIEVISDGFVTISDTLALDGGKNISLVVLKDGYDVQQFLSLSDPMTAAAAFQETTIDERGAYSFDFDLEGATGTYHIYCTVEGEEKHFEKTLIFADTRENSGAVIAFMNAAKAAAGNDDRLPDIADVIEENAAPLLMDLNAVYHLGNRTEIARLICDWIETHPAEAAAMDGYAVKKLINKASAVSALSNGAIHMISEDFAFFDLDDNIVSWYMSDFMKSGNADSVIHDKTANMIYESLDAFDEKMNEVTATAVIRLADGWGYVKDVLRQYQTEIGISDGDITSSVCRALQGKNFGTYAELAAAVKNAIKSVEATGASGGGGAGGLHYSGGSVTPPSVINRDISPDVAPISDGSKSDTIYFDDLVSVPWAETAICSLEKKGILNGRENNKFYPDEPILREEFVKMIMTAFHFAEVEGYVEFADVAETDWFYPFVKNAYLCGIIKGTGNGNFGTAQKIKRQDMAVILSNTADTMSTKLPKLQEAFQFADDDVIADYAKDGVQKLQMAGVIQGKEQNRFEPQGDATRAEAAKMLYEFMAVVDEQEELQ